MKLLENYSIEPVTWLYKGLPSLPSNGINYPATEQSLNNGGEMRTVKERFQTPAMRFEDMQSLCRFCSSLGRTVCAGNAPTYQAGNRLSVKEPAPGEKAETEAMAG